MEFERQYDLVRSARGALLDYCASIAGADFVREHSSFGRGSIRNLLVHIANTYEFWIGQHGLERRMVFTPWQAVHHVADARALFTEVDALVGAFIGRFRNDYLQERELLTGKQPVRAHPLKLFTHVVTHEFHHKGQVLSLSRHLGYVPVDTDVIR
ncbi:MAG: damage-inducible protein DinB [Chitinophagaceae bacterium]|nr:MAG: damage-inducible protein DinB [Chitinophagaceae bacterium]